MKNHCGHFGNRNRDLPVYSVVPQTIAPQSAPGFQTNLVILQGGSNMTGTDLCVNKPHCAAAVRP